MFPSYFGWFSRLIIVMINFFSVIGREQCNLFTSGRSSKNTTSQMTLHEFICLDDCTTLSPCALELTVKYFAFKSVFVH